MQENQLSPETMGIPTIWDYFLTLKMSGLSISSLQVHLVTISAFRLSEEGYSIFTHPTAIRFLKGLIKTFWPMVKPTPLWDLNLVFSKLTRPTLWTIGHVFHVPPLHKFTFLITITPARKVTKLGALMADLLYATFHKEKVSLHLHTKLIAKVVAEFHNLFTYWYSFQKPHPSN